MTFAFILESVGGTEWLVLLGVVLIVVGPKNLPAAARKMGQIMSTLRRAADEFKRQLMTMDQEVRKVVDEVKSDYVDTPKTETSSTGATASESTDRAETDYENPYPEESGYPGHDDFYDETTYQDYGPDGEPVTVDESTSAAVSEPSQPKPPTDEELRAIKITVSKAPGTEKRS